MIYLHAFRFHPFLIHFVRHLFSTLGFPSRLVIFHLWIETSFKWPVDENFSFNTQSDVESIKPRKQFMFILYFFLGFELPQPQTNSCRKTFQSDKYGYQNQVFLTSGFNIESKKSRHCVR